MNFLPSTVAFILIILLLFYFAASKYRSLVLLIASLLFCYRLDSSFFLFLIFSTFFAWITGLGLGSMSGERKSRRKILYIISILFFILSLSLFKCSWDIAAAIDSVYFEFLWLIVLPVGFSFYAFQVIGYLTDVYTSKIPCEKNPVNFFLYMFWFPKWISGPIERGKNMLPMINKLSEVRLFNGTRIIRSLSFITWGLFLKLVIADRIGLFVDNVYMDHSLYSGITLFLTAVLYSVQIYCDFAGYTDIMIGISELFGISLSQNFKTPYLASNISEFWRGWHMTLSSFLRDYIYIPLGGNRKGDLRKYINIMIVFLVCGFWHGNGYKFLAWGLLHGIFSVLTDLASKSRLSILVKGIPGTVINFFLVTFAWIFFRADSLSQAVSFILAMISGNSSSAGLMADIKLMEIESIEIHIAIVSMIILFIADYMAASKKTDVPELICNTGEIKRDMVFVFISVIVLIFGKYGETDIGKFIYMAF